MLCIYTVPVCTMTQRKKICLGSAFFLALKRLFVTVWTLETMMNPGKIHIVYVFSACPYRPEDQPKHLPSTALPCGVCLQLGENHQL